jgi:hypothetical protein
LREAQSYLLFLSQHVAGRRVPLTSGSAAYLPREPPFLFLDVARRNIYTVRVKPETSPAIGRWLSVPPAFVIGFIAACTGLMYSVLLDQKLLSWTSGLQSHVPPPILVSFFNLVLFVSVLAIWTIPTAFAVGFALRTRPANRFQWGLTVALLLEAADVWASHPSGLDTTSHIAVVAAVVILISGIALSFRLTRKFSAHSLANAAAFAVLTLPCWLALAEAPKFPPSATRLWSTVLDKRTWPEMNTGPTFDATRKLIFVGDRVLVIFDAGFPYSEDKRLVSNYRLLSLDATTGETKYSREFVWSETPHLFATNDGHALLEAGSLKSLNPDLTEAGPQFAPNRGDVIASSHDGSTIAWSTGPGTVLLDSRTLKPVGNQFPKSDPLSISANALVTLDIVTGNPKDGSVELTDEHGSRLQFHGDCGGLPEFLNNKTLMLVGCGKIRTMDRSGTILRKAAISGFARFAGVSQNGKRFALEFYDEKGDFPVVLYEYFIVYDTDTLRPLATVRLSELPANQSWSALSADGRYFVAGNPDDLSLYQLP